VDIVVARRFKARGMSWFRPGAAALQRLRELKLNGEWDGHWQQRDRATAHLAAWRPSPRIKCFPPSLRPVALRARAYWTRAGLVVAWKTPRLSRTSGGSS
ncbi:MAG: hypothetical protein AAB113_06500, partial [Candidatus Eisenbacteria bacterium]